jgi:hypothetical protein
MPAALAIDPFGRFLYVTNLDGTKGDPEGDPGVFDNVTSYRQSGFSPTSRFRKEVRDVELESIQAQ